MESLRWVGSFHGAIIASTWMVLIEVICKNRIVHKTRDQGRCKCAEERFVMVKSSSAKLYTFCPQHDYANVILQMNTNNFYGSKDLLCFTSMYLRSELLNTDVRHALCLEILECRYYLPWNPLRYDKALQLFVEVRINVEVQSQNGQE